MKECCHGIYVQVAGRALSYTDELVGMLEADKIGLKPGARLLPAARQYTTAAGVYESGDKLREYVHQTSKAVCSVRVACAASDAARARWLILIDLTRRVGRSSIVPVHQYVLKSRGRFILQGTDLSGFGAGVILAVVGDA